MTSPQPPSDATTLAARLNWLFSLTPATNAIVAAAVTGDRAAAATLSKSYLTALRSGRQRNPTISVVSALVRYFTAAVPGLAIDTSWLIDGIASPPRSDEEEMRIIAARAGRLPAQLRDDLIARLQAHGAHPPGATRSAPGRSAPGRSAPRQSAPRRDHP